jgi:hypothetical protein
MLPFSAECLWISAPHSPARWLYPLKPDGEQKSADVRRKTVTLIYPDPVITKSWKANNFVLVDEKAKHPLIVKKHSFDCFSALVR